jgi:hypothetical protein
MVRNLNSFGVLPDQLMTAVVIKISNVQYAIVKVFNTMRVSIIALKN